MVCKALHIVKETGMECYKELYKKPGLQFVARAFRLFLMCLEHWVVLKTYNRKISIPRRRPMFFAIS